MPWWPGVTQSTPVPHALTHCVTRRAIGGTTDENGIPMTHARTPEHRLFAKRIKELYLRCGSPSSSALNKIISRFDDYYPLEHGHATLPESVSRSALSQILNGVSLCSAGMLTVIVRGLERCGVENESLHPEQAPEDMQEWQRLLREAKVVCNQKECDQMPESDVPDTAICTEPVGVNTAPRVGDPVQLEPGELAELKRHGSYAIDLASRAREGDREAIYEIAVMVGAASPEHGHKAVGYLINAAAAGQRWASALIPPHGRPVEPAQAASHAVRLADEAKRRGAGDAEQAFRSCVAQYGSKNRSLS